MPLSAFPSLSDSTYRCDDMVVVVVIPSLVAIVVVELVVIMVPLSFKLSQPLSLSTYLFIGFTLFLPGTAFRRAKLASVVQSQTQTNRTGIRRARLGRTPGNSSKGFVPIRTKNADFGPNSRVPSGQKMVKIRKQPNLGSGQIGRDSKKPLLRSASGQDHHG